jgi:hypothetical protein
MTGNKYTDYQVDYNTLTILELDVNDLTENYGNPSSSEHDFDYIFRTGRFQNIYRKDITLKSLHKRWSLID